MKTTAGICSTSVRYISWTLGTSVSRRWERPAGREAWGASPAAAGEGRAPKTAASCSRTASASAGVTGDGLGQRDGGGGGSVIATGLYRRWARIKRRARGPPEPSSRHQTAPAAETGGRSGEKRPAPACPIG